MLRRHVTVWTVGCLYLPSIQVQLSHRRGRLLHQVDSGSTPMYAIELCQHSSAKWVCDLQTAAEISKSAMDNSDQLAVEAVDLFLALIGAEAGHMGLRSLASGGIYICGGIMPKVIWLSQPHVESPDLCEEHCVPVH